MHVSRRHWFLSMLAISAVTCQQFNAVPPTATPTATAPEPTLEPPTQTPSATRTPPPTSTIPPSLTATKEPEWISEFAAPILDSIRDVTPAFSDDFSNRYSGWTVRVSDSGEYGQAGYLAGEYFVVTPPYQSVEHACMSGRNDRFAGYADFVLEVDMRIMPYPEISGYQTTPIRKIRYSAGTIASVHILFNVDGQFIIQREEADLESYRNYESERNIDAQAGRWVRILLIARDRKYAVFADSEPLMFVEEENIGQTYLPQVASFSVCNFNTKYDFEARWDNYKVWKIT